MLEGIKVADSGIYACQAANIYGSITQEFQIVVISLMLIFDINYYIGILLGIHFIKLFESHTIYSHFTYNIRI